MYDGTYAIDESQARHVEEGKRVRKLFSAVVMAALDDAIKDDKDGYDGVMLFGRWARSRDGQEVLQLAGLHPGERTIKGLEAFVKRGVRTSIALAEANN